MPRGSEEFKVYIQMVLESLELSGHVPGLNASRTTIVFLSTECDLKYLDVTVAK